MNRLMNLLLRFCLRHCYPTRNTSLFVITYLNDVYDQARLKELYRYWKENAGDFAEYFCLDKSKQYYRM